MNIERGGAPALIHDPFHPGERYVQDRAGSREMADRNAVVMRTGFDDKTSANMANADIAAISTRTATGLRVDLLGGQPCFAELTSRNSVRLNCHQPIPEELNESLDRDPAIGCVTVSLSTRQRARINGHATAAGTNLDIIGREVFFNCNKYITTRTPTDRTHQATPSIEELVAAADMFFIGSRHPERGLDASHRGGHPGVLTMADDQLRWREYPGNDMYQTLGNLTTSPDIAVLVPDLSSGTAVHFTGTARIDYQDAMTVAVVLQHATTSQLSTSQRWEPNERSPHNPSPAQPHGCLGLLTDS